MLYANCIRWFSYSIFTFSLCACTLVYLFILQRVMESPSRLPPILGHVVQVEQRWQAPLVLESSDEFNGGNGNGNMLEYNFSDTNHQPDANGHVNPHPFRYVLTPRSSTCRSNDDIYLFIYVHSAPKHRKRRDVIRSTWANVTRYVTSVTVRSVFVMGLPMSSSSSSSSSSDRSSLVTDVDLQAAVVHESLVNGDIIQEDFVDSYRNLTYKAVAAMRWITENCFRQGNDSFMAHGPRYVLKTDDDAFVNIFAVLRYLRRLDLSKHHGSSLMTRPLLTSSLFKPPAINDSARAFGVLPPGMMMCDFKRRRPVSRTGKWKSTMAERRHKLWPPFCLGLAYILTGSLVPVLYRSSFHVPFLWLDDVYVTGFLPLHLGRGVVRHVALNQAYVFQAKLRERVSENIAEHNHYFGEHWNSAKAVDTNLPATVMFSHVHDPDLYLDVWNDLLIIERRKRRQRRHREFYRMNHGQPAVMRRVNDSVEKQV